MVYAFNPSNRKARQEDVCEFKDSLAYRESFRTALSQINTYFFLQDLWRSMLADNVHTESCGWQPWHREYESKDTDKI